MSLVSLPTLHYYYLTINTTVLNFLKTRQVQTVNEHNNINNMKYSIALIYDTKYSMAASLAVILLGRFRVALKRAGFWFVEFAW